MTTEQTIQQYFKLDEPSAKVENVEFNENGTVKFLKNGSECILLASHFSELYDRFI